MPGTNGCSRRALSTTERAEAERLARQLLAVLLQGPPAQRPGGPVIAPAVAASPSDATAITLEVLWERYARECEAFLDNEPQTRADAAKSIRLLMAVFGRTRDVRTLSPRDLAHYAQRRRTGGIRYHASGADRRGDRSKPEVKVTRPMRQTAVHRDLVTLRTMLRWARTVYTPTGARWLDTDPLDGLQFARERSPRRPVSSEARYQATRAAIQQLAAGETRPRYRMRWVRLELALFLARHTGRRRGAIAGVRWEDCDFVQNEITWRAEYDKKRVEWVTPMPEAVMRELRQFQPRLGSASGFMFPSKRHPSGHIPGDMLTRWLRDAERRAGLPKLKGGLWHPYRRQWASERMHFPIKAVADAGGWRDVATLMKCYQQTDEATLRAVMENASPLPASVPWAAPPLVLSPATP
ncbi:MAG: site-specific integrase, partial [Gemmatimonadaceae bacterium]|nr:site-specific integrase [Gemmatimonadaceae bacterium]